MPKRIEMLTVTQLIEREITTFTKQHINKLIADGVITGVEIVGKTHRIPLTKSNLKALQRKRKEKTQKDLLQTPNNEGE